MIREYLFNPYYSAAPSATEGSRAGYATEKIIKDDKVDFRTLKDKQLLYILFRRDPICWRIVKARAALAAARGFKIIPQSPEARNVIKEFLFSLHKTDPITALLVGIRELAEDTSWSGTGFWEKIYSKEWSEDDDPYKIKGNNLVGLKKIHPLTFDFKRNVQGEIEIDEEGKFGPPGEFLGYTQTFTLKNSYRKKDVDKRRICHLIFNRIGDEPLGISDIEPIYKTRHRGASIEDGIAQGAFRHGVPFLDVTVGDADHPPDKEMLDNAKDEVQGSSYMSEFVHPPWYKINLFEQFSLARSRGMLDPFLDLCSASTGLPRSVLMGTGEGTNKATVRELVDLIQPLVIAPMQQSLKLFLESQVFAPLMQLNNIEGIPLVQWNELFPTDYSLADKLLVMSQINLEGKPLLSWTEAREIAKFPSEEEGAFYTMSRQYLSANSRGIYLPEPHGRLLHEGMKTSIVSDQPHNEMVGVPLMLVSGNQAYGKIKLNEPDEISLQEFKKYQSSHRITDEEREEQWPSAKKLYLFKFKIIELFKFSRTVQRPSKNSMFLSNVNFSNEFNISAGASMDEK